MVTAWEVYQAVDRLAPFSSAEEWDNSGFLLGRKEKPVKRILFCVDLTREVASLSRQKGADLILCHHPVIFRPVSSVTGEMVFYPLLERDTALIAAHTNLDQAENGVTASLIRQSGLAVSPRQPEGCSPYLRFCDLPEPMTGEDFAKKVCGALGLSGCRVSDGGKAVTRVAVCGGAGGEFWGEALLGGAQLLLTGEAKHDQMIDGKNQGLSMVQLGHQESERVALRPWMEALGALFPKVEMEAAETLESRLICL